MAIFEKSIISERRKKTAKALEPLLQSGDLLLFYCGEPVQKPGGLDQTYDFLPHPEYFWLTGSRRPWGVLAFSREEGWVDFVRPISREEIVWEGAPETPEGMDVAQLNSWMEKKSFQRIFVFGQALPSQLALQTSGALEFRAQVQERINEVRRVKDAAEIELIQNVANIASRGYQLLKTLIRPGVSERQIQIEYEAEVLRAGSEKFPYGTIVGTGSNAAILHALPTDRVVQKGEWVLIDAGADRYDYCVDITRVFSADGSWSSQQKSIYDLVFKSQMEAIQKCRPGIQWTDVHRTAARVMADGLKSLNLMQGETDSLLETGAISVFFPHGVGHMVGLKVRDVGGKYNQPPGQVCGVRIRVDLELKENFLMTVEPGLYFVKALIEDKSVRQKYKDQINWSEVERWKNLGGVRLEDDILISAQGPQNLTAMVEK